MTAVVVWWTQQAFPRTWREAPPANLSMAMGPAAFMHLNLLLLTKEAQSTQGQNLTCGMLGQMTTICRKIKVSIRLPTSQSHWESKYRLLASATDTLCFKSSHPKRKLSTLLTSLPPTLSLLQSSVSETFQIDKRSNKTKKKVIHMRMMPKS